MWRARSPSLMSPCNTAAERGERTLFYRDGRKYNTNVLLKRPACIQAWFSEIHDLSLQLLVPWMIKHKSELNWRKILRTVSLLLLCVLSSLDIYSLFVLYKWSSCSNNVSVQTDLVTEMSGSFLWPLLTQGSFERSDHIHTWKLLSETTAWSDGHWAAVLKRFEGLLKGTSVHNDFT